MLQASIPKTFGALVLGTFLASLLSGVIALQIVIYFKTYPEDNYKKKVLVVSVWLLDMLHTVFIWSALWTYLIDDYGHPERIDIIHWDLAISVVLTAVITLFVHLFLAYRVFLLSRRSYLLTLPIVILAILRVLSAAVTTGYMIRLGTFSAFAETIGWNFTIGLTLSALVDVLITISLFILLQTSRTGADTMNVVIDSLIRYAFETGSFTCAGTFATLLCWVLLPNNLVFLGIHFIISKLYGNSLLVTLNLRQQIRRGNSQPGDSGLVMHLKRPAKDEDFDEFSLAFSSERAGLKEPTRSSSRIQQVEVNIERTIQFA